MAGKIQKIQNIPSNILHDLENIANIKGLFFSNSDQSLFCHHNL